MFIYTDKTGWYLADTFSDAPVGSLPRKYGHSEKQEWNTNTAGDLAKIRRTDSVQADEHTRRSSLISFTYSCKPCGMILIKNIGEREFLSG